MTNSRCGDVVLVRFVFSDESGVKRRPALIVSTVRYHKGRQEVIVAAITSKTDRLLIGDHKFRSWKEAGLLHPSTVTGIIRTVKEEMISSRLGTATSADFQKVQRNLREILGL